MIKLKYSDTISNNDPKKRKEKQLTPPPAKCISILLNEKKKKKISFQNPHHKPPNHFTLNHEHKKFQKPNSFE